MLDVSAAMLFFSNVLTSVSHSITICVHVLNHAFKNCDLLEDMVLIET